MIKPRKFIFSLKTLFASINLSIASIDLVDFKNDDSIILKETERQRERVIAVLSDLEL